MPFTGFPGEDNAAGTGNIIAAIKAHFLGQ
jgi:hypothetical protein